MRLCHASGSGSAALCDRCVTMPLAKRCAMPLHYASCGINRYASCGIVQRLQLLLLLSQPSAPQRTCTGHIDCDAGTFCATDNSTGNASRACMDCETQLCSTPPSAASPSGCNLPCTAVDGDCCSQLFRRKCSVDEVFYSGPIVPCSVCDSATVTVQTRTDAVQATLRPTTRMLHDLASGLPATTETFPCVNYDSTLVGSLALHCVQVPNGPPTLHGSTENCSHRTYEATDGLLYSQDPSWQNAVADPDRNCGELFPVAGFNPLISVAVNGVGLCQSADSWATWVRKAFVGPAWEDGEHERWGSFCVDCPDVEAGYTGGTAIIRSYRGTDCSPLTQSRQTHLAMDMCTFDAGRQVRYSATCDVNSFSCPRPDHGVQISAHRSLNPQRAATCASEPELRHAFASDDVGMDHCVHISRNNTFGAMEYQSLRVCCTVSAIRIRYYTDRDCSVPGDTGDNVEYQRGCSSIADSVSDTPRHMKAVCSAGIPGHYCPPLNILDRTSLDTGADRSNAQTGTTFPAVAVLAIIAAVVAVVAVVGLIAAKFGCWDYRKTLFGQTDAGSVAVVNRVIQTKEKSEKEKIIDQYRTVVSQGVEAEQDVGKGSRTKSLTSEIRTESMPSLPGANSCIDDGAIDTVSISTHDSTC